MMPDERWFYFAEEDLKMARLALSHGLYNQVCFHSQQAVEKYIKSVTAELNRKRSHKLADLVNASDIRIPETLRLSVILLDRFYIPTRYPDALPGATEEGLPNSSDANEALQTTIELKEFIQSLI